ncbi:adenosylcobinamide amidohydrolase [Sphaerisporangium melleum]|uniref:Adenosylcobinamide amidohydrolase n=1 Tax=Sphaerisporangium melleum TaxID=321316 RepID=A0A917R4I9_9ACTN|nr:adenosylcobinamide amidohydrolase [Sphaerisporangium melleum]GGK88813.1 adenosylcobinamide amidohydrolase [Sphaerisporangium melleum]GII67729.1 adenosylcobinamide amidohydrolase [Sphaerisporangium melleum]
MPALSHRHEDGEHLASLLWEFGPGWRAISSAMLGGGIGPVEWVLNAQVVAGYSRMDPVAHLLELAPPGLGVGMLTAASVRHHTRAHDGGVDAVATVGLRVPTWAASPEGVRDRELRELRELRETFPAPGTINIIVAVPVAMSDAALVNAVMTVTEAKAQALAEAGYACTGTASDAVCVAARADGPEELFGGPRSTWGARMARAVHRAVLDGAHAWTALHLAPASPSLARDEQAEEAG